MTATTSTTALPLSFAGKTAFVTGGSRGIGAAIVRRLARQGADVVFTYQSSASVADALVASIEADGGHAQAVKADAADAAALTSAITAAAARTGRLDILVNNAGVFLPGAIDDFSLADFDQTLAVNVRAVFVAIKAAVPLMQSGARIINIGSTNAHRMPFGGAAAYAMSKSALSGLTQGLSRDLGPRGITINNVEPGPVATDMNPPTGDFATLMHGLMALPRHGTADEIAGMVAYLASEEAAFVTGAGLKIDGGFAA